MTISATIEAEAEASVSDAALLVSPAKGPAPLEHVKHAEIFREQLALQGEAFRTGLLALRTEFTGNENMYNSAAERRTQEYERARAQADKLHQEQQQALQRRMDDLELAIARADAGMAVEAGTGSEENDDE